MKENDSYGFDFNESYEDIISSRQKENAEFEDIVSDSSMRAGDSIDIYSSSHSYRKKKRGVAGFFQRVGDWWQKLTKGKKAAVISVTSVVLVICLALTWFFTYFGYNYNSIATNPEDLGYAGTIDKNVINVALFGIDTRDENSFKGNSDSIMILSLNTKTKKVKIISIMRDTFVPMEYDGNTYYGKINSAYAKGPEHAIKTLNQAFNLDISEYATVNFYGMTDIIDAVGGITATITEDELKWKGNDHPNLNNCMDEICDQMGLDASEYYIKNAGEQQLNGVQAVAYARVRNCTSVWGTRDDYGRTDRQRHVMEQLFNKALTLKKSQYPKLAKALIPCSETSLSYSDILGLAFNILLSSPTFEQYRLPPAEYQSEFLMTGPTGYGSIIYYDLDYAANLIHGVIYDDMTMEEYIELNGIETNNWYKGGSRKSSTTTSSSVTSSQGTTSSQNETVSTPSESSSSAAVSSEESASSEETSSVSSTNSDASSDADEVTDASADVDADTSTDNTGDSEGTEPPETGTDDTSGNTTTGGEAE